MQSELIYQNYAMFQFLGFVFLELRICCFVTLVYVVPCLAKYFFLTNKKEFPDWRKNMCTVVRSNRTLEMEMQYPSLAP